MAKVATKTEAPADEFDAFLDAIDKQTGDGRDLDRAREISDAYIAAHPAEFTDFVGLKTQDLTDSAAVLNAAGPAHRKQAIRVEMWVRSNIEPQEIGGQVEATRRVIPGFDEVKGN